MPVRPDYLVIGHITRDLYEGGYKIGGTATFAALAAHSLGCRTGIISSAGPDVDLGQLPDDVLVKLRPAAESTTFRNIYRNGHRQQHISAQANVLRPADIPQAWRASPIVHLGPVAQEIDEEVADCFPESLLGLTPQGWMRTWDAAGVVHPAAWRPSQALLSRADAVILSREDVGGDVALIEGYAAQTRLLVLTAGWKGATVYYQGEVKSFPAPEVREVDPTGAGDIFGAAYLVALYETKNPYLAAQFANCVAAHSVERSGFDSIPTEDETARCRAQLGDRI